MPHSSMLNPLFIQHDASMRLNAFATSMLRMTLLIALTNAAFPALATWYPADIISDGQKSTYTPSLKRVKPGGSAPYFPMVKTNIGGA